MRALCRFICGRNCSYALHARSLFHVFNTAIPESPPNHPIPGFPAVPGSTSRLFQFRPFSSEPAQFDRAEPGTDCRNVPSEALYRDGDRLYKIITDNARPHDPMESALDAAGVGLTTDLFLQVLGRLHFEEKTAFRFFTWAGKRNDCYEHEPEAYNEMIDILSSTKYKAKQFRIVCNVLDYMKRNGKKRADPVEFLLGMLRNYTEKHLTHLQKFAKKKRIRVKTQPEINALNLLLDALCKCSLVEEAESLFMRVKSKVKPDSNTYNVLFFGWCRVRNPSRGMRVLDEMIEMGLKPDNFTYNTAIDTFCKAGMVDEAVGLFEFIIAKFSFLMDIGSVSLMI